jgi:hypothetical protein
MGYGNCRKGMCLRIYDWKEFRVIDVDENIEMAYWFNGGVRQ